MGGEIIRIRPNLPSGPPRLLHNGYRVFPGVKRPGRGVDHPSTSRAEVKERVELYFYYSFGPSWPVLGWNLPLPLPLPSPKIFSLHNHVWRNTDISVFSRSCLTCFFLNKLLTSSYYTTVIYFPSIFVLAYTLCKKEEKSAAINHDTMVLNPSYIGKVALPPRNKNVRQWKFILSRALERPVSALSIALLRQKEKTPLIMRNNFSSRHYTAL